MKHKHSIGHSEERDYQQQMHGFNSHKRAHGSASRHHSDNSDHNNESSHDDDNHDTHEHNYGASEHGKGRHRQCSHDEHANNHNRCGCAHGKHGRGRHGDRQHHLEHGLFRGRKFSAQDMQLLLLHFLNEQPSYGYQLIKRFDESSKGLYVPSPGVIYPALTFLAEQDYVTVSAEENRKLYAVAKLGITYLAENKTTLDELLARLALYAQNAEAINQMRQNHMVPSTISAPLAQAEHDLINALHKVHQKTVEEQDKVAELLQQVTKQLVN